MSALVGLTEGARQDVCRSDRIVRYQRFIYGKEIAEWQSSSQVCEIAFELADVV